MTTRDALEELSGLTDSQARCTDGLCRLDLHFRDADALQDQLELVPFHVSWASEGLLIVDAEDPSKAVVYLTREGATLEPHAKN